MVARERKFSTGDLFQVVERLLLEHGYDGLNFGLLAEELHVSRGALYKYYENKEDLVLEYMIHKMHKFFDDIKQIKEYKSFQEQFDFLFDVMFQYATIVQLLARAHENPQTKKDQIAKNKKIMDEYHLEIYGHLEDFIELGKQEGVLKKDIPDKVMLAMIFQTVIMPNHFGVPEEEWVGFIKEILSNGMFVHPN